MRKELLLLARSARILSCYFLFIWLLPLMFPRTTRAHSCVCKQRVRDPTRRWEMFILMVIFALPLGVNQSYSRSYYSNIIPPGYESQFFSMFKVANKGASIFSPIVVSQVGAGGRKPAFSLPSAPIPTLCAPILHW